MTLKAVIFDIRGVLIPSRQVIFGKYEKSLRFPDGFFERVFTREVANSDFCRLERGELLLSEFLPVFQEDVNAVAKEERVNATGFDASMLFAELIPEKSALSKDILQATKVLSKNGYKTCILYNNWVDDTSQEVRDKTAKFWSRPGLLRYFDSVVESCKVGARKPDPKIYKIACDQLGVDTEETICLENDERNLNAPTQLGLKCIKVTETSKALEELQGLTGLKFPSCPTGNAVYPPPCKPNGVPHAEAILNSGIKIHYVDVGEGPVVMMFHGFPESWYSWRHQIPALANAGYRVIAMDQRGYGHSSAPYGVDEYTNEKICQDAIDLMDCLGIPKATIVGHDWGGIVVWELAMFHSDRIRAVCSITSPLLAGKKWLSLHKNDPIFDYTRYFQAEGVAEEELSRDLRRTFSIFFRGLEDVALEFVGKQIVRDTTSVLKRGGFLASFPQHIPRGKMLTEEDLNYYVQRFEKSGFRGPLNWYRNFPENTAWQDRFPERKISIPALMMTASHDSVLKPEFANGMEERIPNLRKVHLKRCSHWAQMEKPDEVNDGLIKWLDDIHLNTSRL